MILQRPDPHIQMLHRVSDDGGSNMKLVEHLCLGDDGSLFEGKQMHDGRENRACIPFRVLEGGVGAGCRNNQEMARSRTGGHLPFLCRQTCLLKCLYMWRCRKRCECLLLHTQRFCGQRIDLLRLREELQVKLQAREKGLEAMKDPRLFVLWEEVNVFPFDLKDHPEACHDRLFVLVTLACNAMVQGVDGNPGFLDRRESLLLWMSIRCIRWSPDRLCRDH